MPIKLSEKAIVEEIDDKVKFLVTISDEVDGVMVDSIRRTTLNTICEIMKKYGVESDLHIVEFDKIDDIADGVYLVHYPASTIVHEEADSSGYQGKWTDYNESWELLIQRSHRYYTDLNDPELENPIDEYFTKEQTRIDAVGAIYVRTYEGMWNEWSEWIKNSSGESSVSVLNDLTSTSTTLALSANMGRELDEKKVDNVRFESTVGDIEAALDSIIALQNTYIETTVTRHYNTCGYYYDEAVGLNYLSIDYEYSGGTPIQCDNMYTAEENASITDDTVGLTIECHVYDTDWNLVYSGTGACRADCGGWALYGDVSSLTLDGTYYLTRADDLAPVNTELPTHEFAEVSE